MSWGQNDLVWHATELLIWHMHRNWATFVSNRSGSAPVLLRTGSNLHHFARNIRPRDRLAPKPDRFNFKPLRFRTGFAPNRFEFAPLRPGYPPPEPTRTETGPVQLQTPPISHRFCSELVRICTGSEPDRFFVFGRCLQDSIWLERDKQPSAIPSSQPSGQLRSRHVAKYLAQLRRPPIGVGTRLFAHAFRLLLSYSGVAR